MTEPLWRPTAERAADTNLARFAAAANARFDLQLDPTDHAGVHRWSVTEPEQFWSLLWDFAGVVASARGETVLASPHAMPGARWFPDARLNFAENLLRRRDDAPALVFRGEDQVASEVTWGELHDQVARLAAALRAHGIQPGDRVCGYLPNLGETIMAMLAAAAVGATWSSCSPDFGIQGVVDRFGQIEPRILFTADGYFYNGKAFDSLDKVCEIRAAIPSIEHVVVVPYTRTAPPLDGLGDCSMLADFAGNGPVPTLEFEQLPVEHPLYVMYSSGTTGVPKCIVHGAGGTLLKHLCEHLLQTDVRADDKLFYFTTCGWMMWNWLASGLAAGATLLLYDGSPFHPGPEALFDFADATGMNIFGTSAKYIDAVKKSGLHPAETHDLGTVRTMLSTGSPLVPESFDFVYRHIKRDLHLASISGGTDIVGCFVLGNPVSPVYSGEIQGPALGMAIAVLDDDGRELGPGEGKGELVCTKPFPSMPVGFWADPDGARYRAAYYEKFAGVWCHGDYVEWTAHGGMIIHGRSDAVLNPGGVRIGTAEIYRQVEQLPEVLEALVIGQRWQEDVRVVLFVRLMDDLTLDADLEARIRRRIRDNTTPRHVPARIVQVPDIPRTKSGKIVELAVRNVVHGDPVKNQEALANPEALAWFANRSELEG